MFLATLEITWDPWGPTWFVAAILAGVAVFVVWLYRIDARRLTGPQRWLLLIWRVLTVFVVLATLMEPSYKLTTTEERPPVVAFVVDESMSMSLPAARDNKFVDWFGAKERKQRSRYRAAKVVSSKLLPDLSKTHRIKIYTVSDQAVSVADFPYGETLAAVDVDKMFEKAPEPTGNYSNLKEVLEDVMRQAENVKLSAMFLLSDGRKTDTKPLADAATEAQSRGIQVNTLGFGTVEPLPDLKLMDLVAPPEANINDVMTIQVTIANTLRQNLRADLKMFQGDSTKPVTTKKLALPMGELRVNISTIPKEEGEIKYTLTLPTFPEELEHANNKASFHVNVVKRRLKVMFVAGSPTMEFHHMVPSLIRDKVVDVSCFLQSADVNAIQQGNEVIEELPRTAAQWDRYDVVILYDINPNQFTNEQENALEQLIYRGGGLMFIAGRVYGMASMLQVRGAKMRAMLPVEINKNLHPNFDEYFTEPFHIVRTKQGEKHPILIFNPGKEKNDEVWQSFADLDFFWHHPVLGVKRQAVPLMVKQRKEGTAGRRDCMMALMRYGKGATMYLGVHTMWRWRFPMESFDYDQFWSQTARYLAEYRMLGSQRQVILSTDKKIYSPGETVMITLAILDPALANILRTEQVFVTVVDEDKGEYKVMLRPSPRDPAALIGSFPARRLGEHEVRAKHVLAEDLAAKEAIFDEKTHFNVRMQSLEFKDTTADLPALRDLAERTGGTALDHSNMEEGIKSLPATVDDSPQLVPHESYDDLWDRWYVLFVLLTLGALELWFRRNWGLL